jgi:hypothetical protein
MSDYSNGFVLVQANYYFFGLQNLSNKCRRRAIRCIRQTGICHMMPQTAVNSVNSDTFCRRRLFQNKDVQVPNLRCY